MANATYEMLEVRFVIKPEWTICYVCLSPPSDGTLGVQGWHAKRFPPNVPVEDILADNIDEAVLWPQEAP